LKAAKLQLITVSKVCRKLSTENNSNT